MQNEVIKLIITKLISNARTSVQFNFYPHLQWQPICSYKFENNTIGIMSDNDNSIVVSNKWYKPRFKYLEQIELPERIKINIFLSSYFLSSKLKVFKDREQNNFYGFICLKGEFLTPNNTILACLRNKK